jgi:hypothetical protein
MNGNKLWQQALDDCLAQQPLSPDNRVLARTLADSDASDISEIEIALHIEQHIDAIGLQPLPDTLQSKLQAITGNSQSNNAVTSNIAHSPKIIKGHFKANSYRFLAMAAGIAMVSLLSVQWFTSAQNKQPTLAEISQAQQELAIAFHYLSIAKTKSTAQVYRTINLKIQRPMTEGVFKPLNHFKES